MQQLDGKVAAITGGSRGIGRAIVEAFIREGACVAFNGRSAENGERAVEEINAGPRAKFFQGDVMNRADVRSFIDGTVRHYGRVDIVVNNAGGGVGSAPVADIDEDIFDFMLRWNLYSAFYGMKYALAHMIPQRSGRIINISSLEGKHGKPGIPAYVTAKHGLNGLTKSCAREVGTMGITVNAICPGLILTDATINEGKAAAAAMGLTFDQLVDVFVQETAIKRLTTVEEVAAMAVLLASEAGAGITGALISIDGGTAAY